MCTTNLLQSIHAFNVNGVPHNDHHHRHQLVDERERTVFEFACHDAFTVHVRQFFNFLQRKEHFYGYAYYIPIKHSPRHLLGKWQS